MNKFLSEIKNEFSKSTWTKKDVLFVMTNFRLFLEEEDKKNEFKFLNHFSNWILHSKITNSDVGFTIIELLTESMIKHNVNLPNSKFINDSVIEGLSFHKLLNEIIKIGEIYGVIEIAKFHSLENWKRFASQLFLSIS